MSSFGWMLVSFCAASAACSGIMLRMGVDKVGGFSFTLQALLALLSQPVFAVGVILYGLAGIGWFKVIATEQLSVAYPILVSLTFVMVSVGAFFFFDEQFGFMKIAGILLIIVGIVLVAR